MARVFDVVEYPNEMRDDIVHRFPESGPGDFRIGSQVIVRESQTVVFFRDGNALDVFGPGRHTIVTYNIPLLINALIQKFNARLGKRVMGVSSQALKFLLEYGYPGNVRELENMIEHAFVLCKDDLIRLDCLPKEIVGMQREGRETGMAIKEKSPLEEAEAKLIRDALKRNEGNRIKTAHELAMSRVTLWRKMRKYGLV